MSCHGHDHTLAEYKYTSSVSVYHQSSCELDSPAWRGVLDTTLGDNVCQ